ncbi:hypothetical protein HYH03_014154 [Edaphochlamys debaryana]|uniref:Uncharacterized protein n=1 Tax=Edaphochlamys debaryana TaxID=47281 RepID=A0A835XWR0_9CHLO|nr:hypothetical protein HYH03_014154 [Edaphochlamys debaryana]|eukprot:KAG2487174.1 hypothetical protein HYH03_014154 [Edaphochlamys debaryana]
MAAQLSLGIALSLALLALAWAQKWPEEEDALHKHYSLITDWPSHSARFNISAECGRSGNRSRLRWAYFTRHSGTLWDWIAVADHLNIPWTRIQNRNLWELVDHRAAPDTYVSTQAVAAAKWRGMGQLMCHMADVLVVADVVPDSRPLLLGNCTTPTLLLVTNRFDVGVREDHAGYYKFMAEVVQRPWVWVVVNNPYDAHYMKSKGLVLPPDRTFLLRPVGASFLPKPDPASAAPRAGMIALIEHPGKPHLELLHILPWLKEKNLLPYVSIIDRMYGGPAVLSHFRGVIQVPYQVSVMKMYESMFYGAVFVVPSHTFMVQLLKDHEHMAFCCRPFMEQHPDTWQEVVDWYNPDYVEGHVLFNSWDELAQILKGEGPFTPAFFSAKAAASRRLMAASRRRSLEGYRTLTQRMEAQSCELLKSEDLWPPRYTTAWERSLRRRPWN